MKEKIEEIKAKALEKIQEVKDSKELNDLRVNFLGKKVSLLRF